MKKLLILVFVLIPWRVYAIGASSYIVMDASSNRVLEGSNIKEERLIASTTKIMTAIVAIENKSLDEKVVVSKDVLKAYGSNIYIEVGEELTLKDLLYGLMLRSGNDAAIEIARIVAGNMDNMAKLMNEKAKALNMTNTLFINASGLENEEGLGNKSTAYDMALLMSYALKNKVFTEIIGTENYKTQSSYKSYVWHNKNNLLPLGAGNQALADIFLQSGNVLRVKKPIQKSQPAGRRGRIGIIGHRQAATHDVRFSLRKGAIQKQRAVCQMNAVSLRREILYQRRQLHQLHDIADFAGDIADRAAFQFLKNFSTQWQLIGHAAIRREKSPVCVDDFVSAEKIITKQGFIDTLAVKPDGLVGLTRLLVLRHGAAPPFPDV